MFTITRSYTFEAAHQLPHVPEGHKCGRMHGHSYVLRVAVAGKLDTEGPEAGMVMEFGRLDRFVKDLVIAKLDHRCLNDVLDNPTSERLAQWIYEKLPSLVAWVELSETARSTVRYPSPDGESWYKR